MLCQIVPAGSLTRLQDLATQLLEPAIAFGLSFAVLFAARRLLLRWIYRKAAGSTGFVASLAETVRFPSILWCLVGGLAVALRTAGLSPEHNQAAQDWIVIFLIISLSLVAASTVVRMMVLYGEHRKVPIAAAGLTRLLIYLVVLSVGAMTLLRFLGVSIAPLLTALGVSGFAVALAMRDELANFFAGVYILLDAPFAVGDVIQLSSGEEGTVTDIGWRSTRLLTGTNNVVVIPNAKISLTVLTNFTMPSIRTGIELAVLAGRDADAAQVMELAIEEATRVPKILQTPAPVIRFDPGVTPTHLQFKLVFHVAEKSDAGAVQSELRLRLLERFRREGVPLPSIDRVGEMSL